jgi:hypothetical protein
MIRDMNIKVVIRIHEMISMKSTGKPHALANALDVSERTVYNYIAFMKEELKAPISYCNILESYYYNSPPGLCFVAQNRTN